MEKQLNARREPKSNNGNIQINALFN